MRLKLAWGADVRVFTGKLYLGLKLTHQSTGKHATKSVKFKSKVTLFFFFFLWNVGVVFKVFRVPLLRKQRASVSVFLPPQQRYSNWWTCPYVADRMLSIVKNKNQFWSSSSAEFLKTHTHAHRDPITCCLIYGLGLMGKPLAGESARWTGGESPTKADTHSPPLAGRQVYSALKVHMAARYTAK